MNGLRHHFHACADLCGYILIIVSKHASSHYSLNIERGKNIHFLGLKTSKDEKSVRFWRKIIFKFKSKFHSKLIIPCVLKNHQINLKMIFLEKFLKLVLGM